MYVSESGFLSQFGQSLPPLLLLGLCLALLAGSSPMSASAASRAGPVALCVESGFQPQLPAGLVLWLSAWNPVPRALALILHCQTLFLTLSQPRLWQLLLCSRDGFCGFTRHFVQRTWGALLEHSKTRFWFLTDIDHHVYNSLYTASR